MARAKAYKLQKGTEIDGYFIEASLGRGWDGDVYHVREEITGLERVMKFYDPKVRSKDMKLYGRKFEMLSRVRGVMRCYHAGWRSLYEGDNHGAYHFVTEFVKGETLEQRVSSTQMPIFRGLRVIKKLLLTVQECHNLGCYVGDIASGNIVVDEDDDPHIIDFERDFKLTRSRAAEDRVAVCKLLHEIAEQPLPHELRAAFPKHADAIEKKYASTSELLQAVESLTRGA